MIVAVFRSYPRPEFETEYRETATRVAQIAKTIPGYLSHKSFVAEDGERLTVVEYASEESLRAWSKHPDHVQAKKLGRQKFYASYKVQVCSLLHEHVSKPLPLERPELAPSYPPQRLRRDVLTRSEPEPDPQGS
jgi:heme-degrading monooxygenase HmoA